jgi:hypothetical protein
MIKKTEKRQYLPFNAVNEFMRDDFRLTILQEVLSDQSKNSAETRQRIGKMISKGVTIPGFRNSNLAPVSIKMKNSVPLFERSAEFAAIVMENWSVLHSELKQVMAEVLKTRGWVIEELDLDRSQFPGFQINWPKNDSFEALIEEFHKSAPELMESDDNISLMAVWVGNRLPYDLFEK